MSVAAISCPSSMVLAKVISVKSAVMMASVILEVSIGGLKSFPHNAANIVKFRDLNHLSFAHLSNPMNVRSLLGHIHRHESMSDAPSSYVSFSCMMLRQLLLVVVVVCRDVVVVAAISETL
jgi:hypothetical protein